MANKYLLLGWRGMGCCWHWSKKILYFKGLSSMLVPTCCKLIVPSNLCDNQEMFSDISMCPLKDLCLSFLCYFFSFSFSVGSSHLVQVPLIFRKTPNPSLASFFLPAIILFSSLFQNQVLKEVKSYK